MRMLIIAALVVVMAGCATTKGPPRIISADGPAEVPPNSSAASLAIKFVVAANAAAGVDATTTTRAPAVASPPVPAAVGAATPSVALASVLIPLQGAGSQDDKSAAMFEAGRTLIYANCSDFFADAGRTQTQLVVWKDAIGLLGTLVAGVIALDGGGGTGDLDRLAVVSLGSSAALSGIDIYTQRFLFAAENVDSVRELTLNALSAHAAKVKEDKPTTYEAASRHLLDNQALCLPPRIAMLARDAIKKGDVVAYTGSGGAASALATTNDHIVMQDIGDRVGLAGPVSLKQAAGYYWLLVDGAEKSEHGQIQSLLEDIPAAKNPFDVNNALNDEVPERTYVRERLARLSPQAVKQLTDFIAKQPAIPGVQKYSLRTTTSSEDIEDARVRIEVR